MPLSVFDDEIITSIISYYTKEAGVRELSRLLATIVRKIVTDAVKNDKKIKKTVIKKYDLGTYLGPVKYELVDSPNTLVPGLVNGLAFTNYGGVVMSVEACMYTSKDDFLITGMVGKSMEESVRVAISYIRSNCKYFKVDNKSFENNRLHLHFLEGATPKDGPSAGITIVTSILSLLLDKQIPDDIAMTGEISLRGDVLKIGGLKEKLIGAYNRNIKQVFIPIANLSDLDEVPKIVMENMDIIPVTNYKEIFVKLFKD